MSHQIRIAGSDVQFPCAEGQTLLDAGLPAGQRAKFKAGQYLQALRLGFAPQDFHSDVFVTGKAAPTTAE